jgi:hypothetical protein
MSYLNKALTARNSARKKLGQGSKQSGGSADNKLGASESSDTLVLDYVDSASFLYATTEDTDLGNVLQENASSKTVNSNNNDSLESSSDTKSSLPSKPVAAYVRTPIRRSTLMSRRAQHRSTEKQQPEEEIVARSTSFLKASTPQEEQNDDQNENANVETSIPNPPPRASAMVFTINTTPHRTPTRQVVRRTPSRASRYSDGGAALRSNHVALSNVQSSLTMESNGVDNVLSSPSEYSKRKKQDVLLGLTQQSNAHKQHVDALLLQSRHLSPAATTPKGSREDKTSNEESLRQAKAQQAHNAEVKRLQTLNQDLRQKLSMYEKEKMQKEVEIERLHLQLQNTQDLETDYQITRETLEQKEEELVELSEKEKMLRRAAEDEITELRSKLREQNGIISELEDRTHYQSHRLQSIQSQLENAQSPAVLDALKDESIRLKQRLQSLQEEKDQKDQLLRDLQQTLEESQTDMKRLQSEMTSQKERFAEKEARIKETVEAQLDMLQTEVAKVAEKSTTDKKRKEETIAVLKKTLASQQKNMGKLEGALALSSAEADKAKQLYEDLLGKLQEKQAELVNERQRAVELENATKEGTELLHHTYAEQIQKLQEAFDDEIEAVRKEGEEHLEQAQNKFLEDLQSRLEQTTEECVDQVLTLSQDREKIKAKVGLLEAKQVQQEVEQEELQDNLDEATRKNEKLQKHLTEKEKEVSQLREDLSAVAENSDQMNGHFDRLRRRLEEEEQRRATSERELCQQKETMGNRLKTNQLSLESFEDSLETKQRAVTALQSEVQFLRSELEQKAATCSSQEVAGKQSAVMQAEEIRYLKAALVESQDQVERLQMQKPQDGAVTFARSDADNNRHQDFEARLAAEVLRRDEQAEVQAPQDTTNNRAVIEHMFRNMGIDEIVESMNRTPRNSANSEAKSTLRIPMPTPEPQEQGETGAEEGPPETPSQKLANRLRATLVQFEDTSKTLASLHQQGRGVAEETLSHGKEDVVRASDETYKPRNHQGSDDESMVWHMSKSSSDDSDVEENMTVDTTTIQRGRRSDNPYKSNISTPSSGGSSLMRDDDETATLGLELVTGSMDSGETLQTRLTQRTVEAQFFTF